MIEKNTFLLDSSIMLVIIILYVYVTNIILLKKIYNLRDQYMRDLRNIQSKI